MKKQSFNPLLCIYRGKGSVVVLTQVENILFPCIIKSRVCHDPFRLSLESQKSG